MSCICEGGFHPRCPIHREVELSLSRGALDVLIKVLTNTRLQDTQREEDHVNSIYKRAKQLREKLNDV